MRAFAIASACGLLMGLTLCAGLVAQNDLVTREVSAEQDQRWKKEVSNWGRWGRTIRSAR